MQNIFHVSDSQVAIILSASSLVMLVIVTVILGLQLLISLMLIARATSQRVGTPYMYMNLHEIGFNIGLLSQKSVTVLNHAGICFSYMEVSTSIDS